VKDISKGTIISPSEPDADKGKDNVTDGGNSVSVLDSFTRLKTEVPITRPSANKEVFNFVVSVSVNAVFRYWMTDLFLVKYEIERNEIIVLSNDVLTIIPCKK